MASDLLSRLELVINQQVTPDLKAQGSDIELVGIDADNIVQVRFLGACQGCAGVIPVLTTQVEQVLRSHVPEVRFVEAVP